MTNPVQASPKLIKRVKMAHSFLQPVPHYHFKLAYVVLHMAVKIFFLTPTSKNGEIDSFNRSFLMESF